MPAPVHPEPLRSLIDQLADRASDVIAAVGGAWAVLHGSYLAIRRWLRRRERRRELDAARDEALTVLLDGAREAQRATGSADDIRTRTDRRSVLYDKARDRLWLARGKERSAAPPHAAPPDEDDAA